MQIMQDGTPVTSFSVATNRRWKTQDGTTQEGNARASLEVRARTVRLLSPRAEAQGLTPGPNQSEDVDVPF